MASQTVAGAAVAGAGLVGALAPLYVRPAAAPAAVRSGEAGAPFRHVAGHARFAAPASTIAAADQLLVNGAPLLVMASGGPGATKAAGLAFAATMLVRAPVYVFQGVAAALLPNLASLNAADGFQRLRHEVTRTARLLLAAAAVVIVRGVHVGGPLGMRHAVRHEYTASRVVFAALGIGVAFYLVAATLSQALLAIDAGCAGRGCVGARGRRAGRGIRASSRAPSSPAWPCRLPPHRSSCSRARLARLPRRRSET